MQLQRLQVLMSCLAGSLEGWKPFLLVHCLWKLEQELVVDCPVGSATHADALLLIWKALVVGPHHQLVETAS